MTLEVNTEYIDVGVTYPKDKYTLVKTGSVDNTKLGRYEIKYAVYSNDGVLVKEMHRFVDVIDSTAPSYNEQLQGKYYVGVDYTLSDFISSYKDNYDSTNSITVTNSSYKFTKEGPVEIEIIFTDSSNNKTTFRKTINPVVDIGVLIEHAPSSGLPLSRGDIGNGTTYVAYNIQYDSSLTHYSTGDSHYLVRTSTSLGERSSIQISAKYGEFNRASVSYHISSGSGGAYSVGFATIDATKTTASITRFSSNINNLNLDINQMLVEFNNQISGVLAGFHYFMNNTLGIEVK